MLKDWRKAEKLCTLCGTIKPATEFYTMKKKTAAYIAVGLTGYCRPCSSKKYSEYQKSNPQRAQAHREAALRSYHRKKARTC